ncbi:MAG: sulfur oxidation protein SoxY [Burkholderiales bacterium]|jgi:sulfur-oxidizing protein SoxY|nr:sulfur oxidation protein SoxY [Burkholderiales bacterium]
MDMLARRRFISALAGFAAVPLLGERNARASDTLGPLIDKVTQGAPLNPGRVKLQLPRLADNGHSVPLKVTVESPMTTAEHVRTITLLSERNPRPVLATFHFGPRAGRAEVVTRVRLNGTQRVVAVAQLSDGSYWSASAEVEVTESACLDAT